MRTELTAIPGLIVFYLDVHTDSRGWFKENWQRAKQSELQTFYPVQNNISFNSERGTTRGIHAEPWDKYVSVSNGKVFAAWVDLREGNEPRVFTIELDPSVAVFVPKGVGNSYQTLEDNTTYTYLVNDHFDPNFVYPALALNHESIAWPIPLDQAIISDKDKANPALAHAKRLPKQHTLIIGDGQLANALLKQIPDAKQLTRSQLDLESDFDLDLENIATVINAAAYTKVDLAEVEPARAFRVNAVAVQKLALQTRAKNVKFVHVSSDYVFDGTQAEHLETETANPLNSYGISKAAGDIAAALNPNHLIVRTSWVIGEGKNFIETIKRIDEPKVVNNQFGRPTFASDLASGILHLMANNAVGTFNLSNDGPVTTWFELAKLANPKTQPTDHFAAKAARPVNSSLNLTKIKDSGFYPRDWRIALEQYLEEH